MEFNYRTDVLKELARHGVAPTRSTPPEIVREFVNDLYLYEVRALRRRFRAGEIPKRDYAGQVEALRNRYPVLSLSLRYWTAPLT